MMTAEDVMNTQEWQAATSAISTTPAIPARVWHSALSRHLKLACFLEGLENANDNTTNTNTCGVENVEMVDNHNGVRRLGTTHPMHVAASQNILKLGKMILEGLASPAAALRLRDGAGRTPLHWAAMADRSAFVLMLLEKGAPVDALDSQNRTPLLSSSAFGATGSVRLLLQWGADVAEASRGGLTPLHAAAAAGHLEIAEILLAAGADVNQRTEMGANPRHCAEKQGHADVVRLLLRHSRGSTACPSLTTAGEGSDVGGQGHGCWGSGDGDSYRDTYTNKQRETFAQHRFDRQSLLLRPLFR